MKRHHEWIIPMGVVLFTVVICSAYILGSEPLYHYKWKRIAEKNPSIASTCKQCGYWFSHKHMTITAIPNGYRWDCNGESGYSMPGCYSKLWIYEEVICFKDGL